MSRMTLHTNRPAIRAIGLAALALLGPGVSAGAAALDHDGDAGPRTLPAAAQVAPPCASAGPHMSRERFLCYRAAANLANERLTMPMALPSTAVAIAQTAEATNGIGSAEGTGVSRPGSATRQ